MTTKSVREVKGIIIVPRGYDRPVFQGDTCFVRVADLPAGATKAKDNIVAHSETGHHHVAERAVVFTTGDAMQLFMRAIGKEPIKVVHKRPTDTHKTIQFPAGETWQVRRQREHTPEGWRRVMD